MKKINLILVSFCLILVGCSDDDSATGSGTVASVSGTYTATSGILHPGGDCSVDDGVIGMCMTDETAMTEADCPIGMCMDGSGSDGDSCPEDYWLIGMCLDEDGDGLEDEASQASADACATAGGNWMVFGWMSLIDAFGGLSITFHEDGSLSDPNAMCNDEDGDEIEDAVDEASCTTAGGEWEDATGTWTLVGSTLTITDAECVDQSGENIDAVDEAACTTASGIWDVEVNTGTVSGDTISINMSDDGECWDNQNDEEFDVTTEEECTTVGGEWEDASCIEVTLTSSGS